MNPDASGLPGRILPSDYLGQQAWRRRVEVLHDAGRSRTRGTHLHRIAEAGSTEVGIIKTGSLHLHKGALLTPVLR